VFLNLFLKNILYTIAGQFSSYMGNKFAANIQAGVR